MKRPKLVLLLAAVLPLMLFLTFESGCKKNDSNPADSTNNDNTGGNNGTNGNQARNENWLIGTWEGVMPANSDALLSNKKIRMTITGVKLKQEDQPVQNQTHRVYAYSGTFIWDAEVTNWTMAFRDQNFPQPDYNVVVWGCQTMKPATIFVETLSLRICDTTNAEISHNINLDLQAQNNGGSSITGLDLSGDIQIETNEGSFRADFTNGNLLHFTKK
jgi:hypothetical protein